MLLMNKKCSRTDLSISSTPWRYYNSKALCNDPRIILVNDESIYSLIIYHTIFIVYIYLSHGNELPMHTSTLFKKMDYN